jgi:hypothetical protein
MSIRNSTGHTLLVERARGPQWYVKLRTPEGRQVKRLLGPAWSKRGRPPEGFFTEALVAAKLEEMLMAADRGEYDDKPAHTFGAACREWLRYLEHEEQVAEVRSGRPRVRATLTPRLSGRARRSRVRERDRGPPRLRAHQGRVLRRARGCGLRPPAREGPEA